MSEKQAYSTEAPNLTLEQFENYDVSGFSDEELKKFIKEFYDSHPNVIVWNLNKWDVSHITCMYALFYGFSNLKSINLSDWNTSNVINMCNMFRDCKKLKFINLSCWKTSYFPRRWDILDNTPFHEYSLDDVISHSPATIKPFLTGVYKDALSDNVKLQKQVTTLQQENEALKALISQLMLSI